MQSYKLLTPGPLTTSTTVKQQMMFDHCTWDDEYKQITQAIRHELLDLAHVSNKEYTVVLMQGSGSFGVESVITSAVGKKDKILIVSNGAYGQRMRDICVHADIPHTFIDGAFNLLPDAALVGKMLDEDTSLTHVIMVHSETTTGILNNIAEVGVEAKKRNRIFIVDAMSSFGGVDMDLQLLGIDFLVSSANKCIQGVPGFSFIIARRGAMINCKGKATSLSLDLYDQWVTMEKDGKWRFTSPTHAVMAFHQALKELRKEGGIPARAARYARSNQLLIQKFMELGIKPYIDSSCQGPIITSFYCPMYKGYTFEKMYNFIKEKGYAIYPGKLTDADTFRVGNIGEIYESDIEALYQIMKQLLVEVVYG